MLACVRILMYTQASLVGVIVASSFRKSAIALPSPSIHLRTIQQRCRHKVRAWVSEPVWNDVMACSRLLICLSILLEAWASVVHVLKAISLWKMPSLGLNARLNCIHELGGGGGGLNEPCA